MMNWVISSSILILIVITIRHFLKGKMSLRLQYALWLIVAARLLVPFSIGEAVTSVSTWLDLVGDRQEIQEIVDYTKAPMQTMTYEDAYESVVNDYREIGINIENLPEHVLNGTIENEVQDKMHQGYSPEQMAVLLWKLGMVIVSAWFLYSNIYFSLKLRKDRVLCGEKGRLKVYQTSAVETPCLYGLFTPAIYVTNEVVEDETRMQHVLEHEMTHYRHCDYIWALVRVLCLVLHWYNPLVWCAALLSRRDAELACDEATIKRLGEDERASYGRTLIGLTCEKRPAVLITATTMTGSKNTIKERIKLIAQKPKMAIITLVVVVLLMVVAIVWTYTGAKPQYESFSEWVETLKVDEFDTFHLAKGYGNDEIRYQATKEDFVEFLELLKAVPEEKCYRRDQSATEYEDYRMGFHLADSELLLLCLEDKTLRCVWASYMPEFAPKGKKLIIDSSELWNYIVDTVNEKGTVSKENSIVGLVENVHYEMLADLNHDGIDDLLKVVTGTQENAIWKFGTHIQVFLGTADGTFEKEAVYKSENVYDSHSQNGTFVLSEREGKEYLLYSVMYENQGEADYKYEVMRLNGNELVTVQSDAIGLVLDPFKPAYWEGNSRQDKVPQFRTGLEPWIENAIILVSYDVNAPTYLISESTKTPASTYYNSVWERNEEERLREYYAYRDTDNSKPGMEEWERLMYREYYTNYEEIQSWFEALIASDYSQWYEDYDGSKLQRLGRCEARHKGYECDVVIGCDITYYRADAEENEQIVAVKMVEEMTRARMVENDDRAYVVTAFRIPEQKLVPIADDMWLITFLQGYHAYEGRYIGGTMQDYLDSGDSLTEDGLIPVYGQGGDSNFYFILMEKDGVYRLERLNNMMSAQ